MCDILIVEDESRIAGFVQKGLSQAGYRSKIVGDGYLALEEVAASDYRLILLDLGLPGVDGRTVLKALRYQGNSCPVFIVTASQPSPSDAAELKQLADGWVQKPFKMKDLIGYIRRVIPIES